MSITDHLQFRLRWDGKKGLARSRDVVMTLVTPPMIGFSYAEIDYAPGCCAMIRRVKSDPLSDMTGDEVSACRLYLAALDGPDDIGGDF